jgi:hypothetical protein
MMLRGQNFFSRILKIKNEKDNIPMKDIARSIIIILKKGKKEEQRTEIWAKRDLHKEVNQTTGKIFMVRR